MQVGNCTTPAQYFHALRRQMRGGSNGQPLGKPLVLFTPKSLLRHAKAVSKLEELTSGRFHEVLDDASVHAADVTRVLFCSGKVYYDLLAGREERGRNDVAIVRVEQLYPFPQADIEAVLHRYPATADVYWVQEEPRNMGPWRYMLEHSIPVLTPSRRMLKYAGRPEYASPAAGTTKRHEQEQAGLVADAFDKQLPRRYPKRVRIVRK
jgi:2-oxoglutarate dehydrogenase E1 component